MDMVLILTLVALILLVVGPGLHVLWQRDRLQLGEPLELGSQRVQPAGFADDGDRRGLDRALLEDYIEEWRVVQARFVDEPEGAVVHAHRLVHGVMRALGCSPDALARPDVVEAYRAASAITEDSHDGQASTEALREAMVLYRSVLCGLLDLRRRERRSRMRGTGRTAT